MMDFLDRDCVLASRASYHSVRICIAPEQLARLGNVKLVPSMRVKCFLQSREGTVISHLLKGELVPWPGQVFCA